MKSKILDKIIKNRKGDLKLVKGECFKPPPWDLQHRYWPSLPQNRTPLFSECTLFLYSIFALFIQYLNLYKTLWWLPKSHWHGVFKTYLINPYVLSCIGLLLGIRVTMCFWRTITKRFDSLNPLCDSVFWSIVEYALIKSPLCTMITSSFMFSMSRIIREFGYFSAFLLIFPLMMHGICVGAVKIWQNRHDLRALLSWTVISVSFRGSFINSLQQEDSTDPLRKEHSCAESMGEYTRQAAELHSTICSRLLNCVFIAFYTAYYSIYLPIFFVPTQTKSGLTQHFYRETVWYEFMFVNVFTTTFFIYALYQFPMPLLHRVYEVCSHLGTWKLESTLMGDEDFTPLWQLRDLQGLYFLEHGMRVTTMRGMYTAKRHPHFDRVASFPEDRVNSRLYSFGHDPIRLFKVACISQVVLILIQFHNLVMATDWQHICTLVMLMFANYVCFFVYLREYVVVSQIYAPTRKYYDGVRIPYKCKY